MHRIRLFIHFYSKFLLSYLKEGIWCSRAPRPEKPLSGTDDHIKYCTAIKSLELSNWRRFSWYFCSSSQKKLFHCHWEVGPLLLKAESDDNDSIRIYNCIYCSISIASWVQFSLWLLASFVASVRRTFA